LLRWVRGTDAVYAGERSMVTKLIVEPDGMGLGWEDRILLGSYLLLVLCVGVL
jgi:hypothetical protein